MEPSSALEKNTNIQHFFALSKVARFALVTGALLILGLSFVLLYLLTVSSGNRSEYEVSYTRLFALNIAAAAALLGFLFWLGLRLIKRLRQKRFGSQLLLKLAFIFGLVGFLPGVLIYVVSYQFVSRSIETWFDVKVEQALSAGVSLGRTSLDVLSDDLIKKSKAIALPLAELSDTSAGLIINRMKEQAAVDEVILWGANNQILASTGTTQYLIKPTKPPSALIRRLRTEKTISVLEGLDEATLPNAQTTAQIKVYTLVGSPDFNMTESPRYLQLVQTLPTALVMNANAVTVANQEYQERAIARLGLKRMYIGTLTLALIMATTGAVILAVVLGNQLARPLLLLTEGVQQVASGDLRPRPVLNGNNELDGLTRSFAIMTQQLLDAKTNSEMVRAQIEDERGKLQTILDNLSSGVMVIDEDGLILSANPAVAKILFLDNQDIEGVNIKSLKGIDEFTDGVLEQFKIHADEFIQHQRTYWQHPFRLQIQADNAVYSLSKKHEIHLIARGAVLPISSGNAPHLLVFDDISQVVSAQRSQAWAEVAQRLAHEIKNPLTPIQLSAQRLERRLTGKLIEADALVLEKSVKTIVQQVDAMKNLVNEFREYARLPVAKMLAVDLNALIIEVSSMYKEESMSSKGDTIVLDLDQNCIPILGDSGQLRQVVHNLLQNAQDACEIKFPGCILLQTKFNSVTKRVRLVVTDHGTGFAEHILARAFEPYVTTKSHGTGLGLAVVKKIADDHGARLELSNKRVDGKVEGAQVLLSFATEVNVAHEVAQSGN